MGKLLVLITLGLFLSIGVERLYAYPSSKSVRDALISEMDAQASLGAHDIEIDVRQGVVTLSGVVSSELDSATIARLASEISGVKEVNNYLVVSHPISSGSILAKQIRQKLKEDSSLTGYNLDVKVREGVAHISGEVRAQPDLRKIEALSKEVIGIDEVKTNVRVKPAITDEALVEQVRQALSQESGINLSSVYIRANNGIVTFDGVQSNHREIDRILTVALMVEGVKDVHNNMKIGQAR